ncbi:MAG: BrnT family toxin [Thermodesulfobacteriota bacterium]|nr:BrnT family toxin [Thermodesulfobacteriota bacterium]
MQYDWDEQKNTTNREKHGIDFETVVDFCWDSAIEMVDNRNDYGEQRYITFGLIGHRLFCMVYTIRANTLRIISLRKANSREVNRYERHY